MGVGEEGEESRRFPADSACSRNLINPENQRDYCLRKHPESALRFPPRLYNIVPVVRLRVCLCVCACECEVNTVPGVLSRSPDKPEGS